MPPVLMTPSIFNWIGRKRTNRALSAYDFTSLCHTFLDFKSLLEEVQRGLVAHMLYETEGDTADSISIHSLDTEMAIKQISIMRLAYSRCRNLVPEMKEGWGRRAPWLITLPCLGTSNF